MKLLTFSVQNYRSIAQAETLPCDSAITTLVGPNNARKIEYT